MRNCVFAVAISIATSGCGYYPDLYSIDTSELRQRAEPLSDSGDKFFTEVVMKSEACLAAAKSDCRGTVLSSNQTFTGQLSQLERSIVEASKLQDHYEKRYKDISRSNDILQLPVLIAAGATGLILVEGGEFSEGSRTTRAAEIGVIASTFAAGRGALTSRDMPEYYIKGHGALNCVIAYGMNFSSVQSSSPYQNLIAALRAQLVSMAVLEDLLGQTPSDSVTANLTTARALADTALGTARTARRNGLTQLVSADRAPLEFDLEASEISVLVATKGQSRTSANYETITAAFQQSGGEGDPTAGAGSTSGVTDGEKRLEASVSGIAPASVPNAARPTANVLADRINKQINRLRTTTATLEGASPNYKDLITQMKACSTIVSS